MCGIAGHISFNTKPELASVAQLTAGIRHRGPDEEGLWSSPDGQCVLGQTRLSIIDLSPLGKQPMYDPLTKNCIVFNGEIYNFQELRIICETKGEKFISKTDTEVILVLYRLYGIDCLYYLRGMFAFALWDEKNQFLFVARDRLGIKPFNYVLKEDQFIFCSEIDPLVKYPRVDDSLNPDALDLYLQHQYIPAPYSIYNSIKKILPSNYGIFDKDGLKLFTYWNIDYRKKIHITENDAMDSFEEKLTESVRLRMIADVPMGALLSGGVDSSVIVAIMSKLSQSPIRTFSIGFDEQSHNELPYALQVAERYNTNHTAEIINGNVADMLPMLVKYYGEPYADSSSIPSFLVSQFARKHVTVVLNGDGGDELLGGYSRYELSNFQMNISPFLGKLIPDSLAARMAPALWGKSRKMKLGKYLLQDLFRPETESLRMYNYFFNDLDRKNIFKKSGSDNLYKWRLHWFTEACKYANHPFERMLWYDNHTYLPDDLLVKMDIATMHTALEARSPLLDHTLIEFCASLPVSFKNSNRISKYLLKKIGERYFPKEFIHRKKQGFSVPLTNWLQGSLKEITLDTLHSRSLMEPLDYDVVINLATQFYKGKTILEQKIWLLLVYGIWRNNNNYS